MKKKIALVSLLLLAVLSPLMADKLVFTEVGVSFASIIMPRAFESNATGTYDTAAFDLKAGFDIFKWADIYVGGGFQFFADRPNPQGFDNYYTFYPVYGGIRANIFPDLCVYPDVIFEYGTAFANRHIQFMENPYQVGDRDHTWMARYYSYGFGINWHVNDVSTLSLRIERPSFSNLNVSYGELQVIKAGLAWKILY